MSSRKLYDIAKEIRQEWPNPYFGAVPYINAMACMGAVSDYYGTDPGKEIVLYFLSNANTFRGKAARRIKKELKDMIK